MALSVRYHETNLRANPVNALNDISQIKYLNIAGEFRQRDNMTGCSKDPVIEAERRRKLSEANTGRKPTKEQKQKRAAARERFRNSPEFAEYCKHMSEILTGIPKPKPKTVDYKIKSSEAAKKRWQDPGYRDKTIKGMVRAKSTPEFHELRSKISKKQMGDPEARKRVGDANRGRSPSAKTRALLSARSKGENNPMYGIRLTGENNHFYGKHHSEETKEILSKRSISPETRKRISEAARERGENPIYGKKISTTRIERGVAKGERNPNWKGGVSFEPYCPKFNREFKERVRAFFHYECIECGTPQNGKKLGVHHINFDKMSCCNDTPPLFVPLCQSCHAKTNHNRPYWEQYFTALIDDYYGGKCYFSQEEMKQIGG